MNTKLSVLVFGDSDSEATVVSIKDLNYPVDIHWVVQIKEDSTPNNELPVDVWIEEYNLLYLLRAVVIKKYPILFLHSGDCVSKFNIDDLKKVESVLVPNEGGEGLSGMVFPVSVVDSYLQLCEKVGIYEADEESLIQHGSNLVGGKYWNIDITNFTTFLPYQNELLIQKNRDLISSYIKNNPKDLVYDIDMNKRTV